MPHQAAWSDAAGLALRVAEAPDWQLEKDEIKVANKATSVNPGLATFMKAPIGQTMDGRWPFVFGYDVTGEVIDVGSDVTQLKIGDRVLCFNFGVFGTAGPKSGAFQTHSIHKTPNVAKIPDSWSYIDASVLPLAAVTAAASLFPLFHLGLDYPCVPSAPSNGKILLVWGGSSSVGAVGIQMAIAAGYEVIATCGQGNVDFVKSLGVSQTFQYSSASVIDDIAQAIKCSKKHYVGAFVAMQERAEPLHAAMVSGKLDVKESPIVATNPFYNKEGLPDNVRVTGVRAPQIFSSWQGMPGVPRDNAVGQAIFQKWLPEAMEAKTIRPVPQPVVVGKGLEAIQEALEIVSRGVSGQKLVVEL